MVPVPGDTPLPPHGDGDGPGAVHGRVLTGRGRGAFREAGTGKNGSFSTPSARLPPEQHGSFHRLPNPANPPHNTLKVASGLHAGRHGEAAGGGASLSPPPVPQDPHPGLWGGAGPSGCPHGGVILLGVCGSLRVRSFGCVLCSGVSTRGCPLLWPGGHMGAGGVEGCPHRGVTFRRGSVWPLPPPMGF